MVKRINLALQGGGSFGAYSWGVLDRLLESGKFEFDSISGTSAGAMNTAVLASGLALGGPERARKDLTEFWEHIGKLGHVSPYHVSHWDRMLYGWRIDKSPLFQIQSMIGQLFSPYQMNPFNFHPLREVLEEHVDFDALNSQEAPRVFITTTNVLEGQPEIFSNIGDHEKIQVQGEVTVDALLASACLPTVFQAVKIGEGYHWDGGFTGNPSLWPLIYSSKTHDILIIEINSLKCKKVPQSTIEISDRLNEINMMSSLIAELRAIDFIRRLIEEGTVSADQGYKNLRMHMVEVPEFLKDLGAASKMNADIDFLTKLRSVGLEQADKWIESTYHAVGEISTLDVRSRYLHKT